MIIFSQKDAIMLFAQVTEKGQEVLKTAVGEAVVSSKPPRR